MLNILNALDQFYIPGAPNFFKKTTPDLWQQVWDEVEFKVKSQARLSIQDEQMAIKRFRELTEIYKRGNKAQPSLFDSFIAPSTVEYATAMEAKPDRCGNINCETPTVGLKPRLNADNVSLLLCDKCATNPRFKVRGAKR
jgi:hypothetical protein